MYLAQETTVVTHRFNHSRKKPPRAKPKAVKPTHKQGPLFADMLHETTLAQKKRAHSVCGSVVIYNNGGVARLYCGRRDCPRCFKRRYKKLATRIYMYTKDTGQKLRWKKIPAWQHAKVVREIKHKNGGEYICLPMVNKSGELTEYILSNVVKGPLVDTRPFHLETNLAIWTKTPAGHKISFSSGFRLKRTKSNKKRAQFFGKISISKIVPYAVATGGTIHQVTKSFVKWKVDAEKLTERLVEDDIVAYQITLPPTLNEEARNAEDALAQNQTNLSAVPVNKKGKAIAPPVKLRQLLIDSDGVVLHKEALVTPLLSKTETQATSPPPG